MAILPDGFGTSRLAPSSVRPGRPSYGLTGAPWWAWSPAGQVDGPARERACCELLWGSAYPGLLLDHLIGACEERGRDREPERLGGLEVDDKLELGRLLDREIGGLGTPQDPVDVRRGVPVYVR